MGKECLAFVKYPALHELEVRHGVDLGQAYKTKDSAKVFNHYIVEGQCQELLGSTCSEASSTDAEETLSLDDWDDLFN